MMNISSPILNSAISMYPGSVLQIAGFAASFAVAVLLHSPVFAIQQIAIARAGDKISVKRLLIYFLSLAFILLIINTLIAFTVLGKWIFTHFIGASEEVSQIAGKSIMAFLPLPVYIAFRGVFQGLLIRNQKTTVISVATGIRLISLVLQLYVLHLFGFKITAHLAAAALSTAVLVETLVLIPQTVKLYKILPPGKKEDYFLRKTTAFSFPLIFSMILWTSSAFFLTSIVGHSTERDAALAITGIVFSSIGWFLTSPVKPIMQMVMVYSENNSAIESVKKFSANLTLLLTLVLLLIQIPPVSNFFFSRIFILDEPLRVLARQSMWLILAFPYLIARRAYLQGHLIRVDQTRPVSFAAAVRILLLILALIASSGYSFRNGAFMGIFILLVSIALENFILCRALQILKKKALVIY